MSKSAEPGVHGSIKMMESLKLGALKRKKSLKSSKDAGLSHMLCIHVQPAGTLSYTL